MRRARVDRGMNYKIDAAAQTNWLSTTSTWVRRGGGSGGGVRGGGRGGGGTASYGPPLSSSSTALAISRV